MMASSRLIAYFGATASTMAACALRILMHPVLQEEIPYETFYVAVLASALYGGVGPGVLALVLGGLSAAYFLVPPVGLMIEGVDNQVAFGMYVLVSGAIVRLTDLQRRARLRAEMSFRSAAEHRVRLEDEITERQRAQAAETLQRQWLEVTLSSIGDGVIATDIDGRVTFINPVAAALTAWSEKSAIGKSIEEVFDIRDELTDVAIENPSAKAIRERHVIGLSNNTILVTKEGRQLPIADSGAPIIDQEGNTVGAVLVFRDVTEKRTREAVLCERDRMIALSQDAIITTDAEKRILTWNAGAHEIYGWEEMEVRGKQLDAVLLRQNLTETRAIDEAIQRDGHWYGDLNATRKDGRILIAESRQVPLQNKQGRITGILEIDRDTTQRKELEERLREAAKLESLGVLAGGIAHDFNNLLTTIMGYASLLGTSAPEGSSERASAEAIVRAVRLASKLTQQMLAYSGRGRFIIEPVQVSNFVREVATLIEASIPKSIELEFDLAAHLPIIQADVAQLQQLVINLLINGAEAIGSNAGRIRIVTRSEPLDAAKLQTLTSADRAAPGNYIMLEVQDTGCGMDNTILSRVFDPFFTTKFTGRGLGLSAVLGIVRGHKGALNIESAPGLGTTFRIFFPACERAEQLPEKPVPPLRQLGFGTVLVVDDDDMIRSLVKTSLEGLGFTVAQASNGEEALIVFTTISNEVRIVILDIDMPGISCEETLRQLRQIQAAIRILLSSGFSEAESMQRFGDLGVYGFLQKPYTVQMLADKVMAVVMPEQFT